MKYIDEFRDQKLVESLVQSIKQAVSPKQTYRLMEFCGGHTHAIFRFGLNGLLPENVQLIHGPGCPVCVLPIARLDQAIAIAKSKDVVLCTYGDMMRVPASKKRSLIKAKAEGADVRMVYSSADALNIARDNPFKQIVFFAIGFETTTPPTAVVIKQAQQLALTNFSVFCNHILTPPALQALLSSTPEYEQIAVDGFIGPAHVSTVIGSSSYQFVAEQFQRPVVIAGFEPADILQSILMLINQLNEGRAEIENEYTRAVTEEGNTKAKTIIDEVFETSESFEWRGLGWLPHSGLKIRDNYSYFDAEKRFDIVEELSSENKACECPSVLRGSIKPNECKIFGTVCTPDNPIGACMVSSEGACAAYYQYARNVTKRSAHG